MAGERGRLIHDSVSSAVGYGSGGGVGLALDLALSGAFDLLLLLSAPIRFVLTGSESGGDHNTATGSTSGIKSSCDGMTAWSDHSGHDLITS